MQQSTRSRYEACEMSGLGGYLLVRNVAKDLIETFALSRFSGIEATCFTFAGPNEFDAEM